MPAVNADAGADGNAVKYPRTLPGRAAYDKYAQANTHGNSDANFDPSSHGNAKTANRNPQAHGNAKTANRNPQAHGNAKTANRNPTPHCETEADRPSC